MVRFTSFDVAAIQARQAPKLDKPAEDGVPAGEEDALHEKIILDLEARRWPYVHSRTDKRTRNKKGVFDFVIFGDDAKVHILEIKTRTGKLSIFQLGWQLMLENLGHKPKIIRSYSEYIKEVSKP